MSSKLSLRIASVLTFIHAVLHTIGGVFGKPEPGPASVAVAAMQSNHFVALGAARTYWDYYMGMGLGVSIFLTAEAIVFWLLASLAADAGPRLRPVLIVFALGYLAFALNSFEYFFIVPVIVEILIALCLLIAAMRLKPLTSDN